MRSAGNRSCKIGKAGGERTTEAQRGGDIKGVHPLLETLLCTLHFPLFLVSSQAFTPFTIMLKIGSLRNAAPTASASAAYIFGIVDA